MFDFNLSSRLTAGGYVSRYNPLINYKWDTVVDSGVMYLKDSGANPKYNAEMNSGKGVLFNGVDQSINSVDYTVNTTTTIAFTMTNNTSTGQLCIFGGSRIMLHLNKLQVDFRNAGGDPDIYISSELVDGVTYSVQIVFKENVVETYLNGKLDTTIFQPTNGLLLRYIGQRGNSSVYYDGILKDLYIFNDTLTPQEITKYSTQPNEFFQDVQDGIIDNCVLNMPLDGTDGYVRDYVNYSEGVELITSPRSVSDTTLSVDGEWSVCTLSASDTTKTGNKPIFEQAHSVELGTVTLTTLEIEVITGTIKVTNMYSWDYNICGNYPINDTLVAGNTKRYTAILSVCETEWHLARIYADYDVSTDFSFKFKWSSKKLTGIYEIENYTTSCRDNTSTLNYGTQEVKFTRDGLWRDKLSHWLELDGTQTPALPIPMTDTELWSEQFFQIEMVIQRELLAKYTYILYTQINNTSGFRILTNHSSIPDRITLYLAGSSETSFTVNIDENLHHVVFTINATEMYITVDGVDGTPKSHSFVPSGLSFAYSVQPSPKGQLRLFKIHKEEQDTSKLYNKAVNAGLLN